MFCEKIKLKNSISFGQTPMHSLGVILKNRFPLEPDLRQVGPGDSLAIGTPL